MATVLAVLALLVAIAALVLVLLGRRMPPQEQSDPGDVPEDVEGLRHEVAALKLDLRGALRNLSVVRYDAFADSGGHLSWSIAVLDDDGSGAVITSIHGRYDTRTYAKGITAGESDQQLSPEEETAVTNALPRRARGASARGSERAGRQAEDGPVAESGEERPGVD